MQVLSCQYCKIFKNANFGEHFGTTAILVEEFIFALKLSLSLHLIILRTVSNKVPSVKYVRNCGEGDTAAFRWRRYHASCVRT